MPVHNCRLVDIDSLKLALFHLGIDVIDISPAVNLKDYNATPSTVELQSSDENRRGRIEENQLLNHWGIGLGIEWNPSRESVRVVIGIIQLNHCSLPVVLMVSRECAIEMIYSEITMEWEQKINYKDQWY